jgi:hypothetical protein
MLYLYRVVTFLMLISSLYSIAIEYEGTSRSSPRGDEAQDCGANVNLWLNRRSP